MNETVATEPGRYAQQSDGRSEFGLTRLIFAMLGVFAGYYEDKPSQTKL